MNALIAVASGGLLVNLPFGFWRAGAGKFSVSWFAAIHLPVLLVAGMRLLSGLGWRFATFLVLLGACVAGQYFGGELRRRTRRDMCSGQMGNAR